MTEQVTKVRVFVASPSDVQRERDSLAGVVAELNTTIGGPLKFVIELVKWETHCHPDAGRPQGVINAQIGTYDIFIGIMWKRFGTPTGAAASGTEEEFNIAYNEWQRDHKLHVGFYFSQAEYKLNTAEQTEQLSRVIKFKEELAQKALTWNYQSAANFPDTVRPHLTKILFEMFSAATATEKSVGILQTLNRVQEQLDEASEHHRVVLNTAGEFTVREKHPGAFDEEPLKISARFEFPDTPEGREMREKFKQTLRTGKLLTIPKEYIKYIKFPPAFSPLVENVRTESLTIGRALMRQSVIMDLTLKNVDGDSIVLNNIQFDASRPSMEKIVLTNENQPTPWKFTLTLDLVEGTLLFNYSVNYRGLNAKRELDAMRFTDAIARGGTLEMVHVDTGLVFQTVNITPGVIPFVDADLLRLVEKTAFIQTKARVPIVIPEASEGEKDIISAEDANRVLETAQKLETGRAILDVDNWKTEVDINLARKLIDLFGQGKSQSLSFSFEDEVVNIFGAEIHLGLVVMTCERTILAAEDLKKLKDAIATHQQGSFPVTFKPLEDTPMLAHYPKWLPQEEGDFLLREMADARGRKLPDENQPPTNESH